MVFYFRIHRVSRCTCNIRYDQAVLPEQSVDDRGFSHIGFAHNGHPDLFILLFLSRIFREMGDNHIQQIPQPGPVRRRNGMRLPDTQIIKFIDVRHKLFKAVHLIYH